jgi:hypothetical protein
MLDPADPIDLALMRDWAERHMVNVVDCLVAYVTDDGFTLTFLPHDRKSLRRIAETDPE